MLLFDIGANRGDATYAALNKGFDKVIALEPAPIVFAELVKNFIYDSRVIPLKLAASYTNDTMVEFYEAREDGLSSLNKEWLTKDGMPYAGKEHRTIRARTVTIDMLAYMYGEPDLIKIGVEGAEDYVFQGMKKKHGVLTFEWTNITIGQHQSQLEYLKSLGYTEFGPQFIEHHLQEPEEWFSLEDYRLDDWVIANLAKWEDGGWQKSGLRPTADVGMCWVR